MKSTNAVAVNNQAVFPESIITPLPLWRQPSPNRLCAQNFAFA
jgi:hypothetical protein